MSKEKKRLDKMRERILGKSKENPIDYTKLPETEKTIEPMVFTIHPNEVEILNKWKENIKGVFGMYGNFEYKFKGTGGLGYEIWVYSDLAKTEICLTKDVDY